MGWDGRHRWGGGESKHPEQVTPSELAAESLQQASAVTPKAAAAKTGREMIWKCALSKDFIF